MENVLPTMAIGAFIGFSLGLLMNSVEFWCKDRRDAKLRQQGLPLPSDRVSGKYHWFFLILGLFAGGIMAWHSLA